MYKIKTIFLKLHNKIKHNKLKKYKRLHEGAWGSLLHVLSCSNATEHRPNVVQCCKLASVCMTLLQQKLMSFFI